MGGLCSASLCEKYVGKILQFWKYEKRKRNISGYQPSQLTSIWPTTLCAREVQLVGYHTRPQAGHRADPWLMRLNGLQPCLRSTRKPHHGVLCVCFLYFAHLVSWVCNIFSKECILKDRTFFNAIVTQTNLEFTYILSNQRGLVP